MSLALRIGFAVFWIVMIVDTFVNQRGLEFLAVEAGMLAWNAWHIYEGD